MGGGDGFSGASDGSPVPDLLGRDFSTGTLNQRWCGDLTYLPVGGRCMYLATVIDIGSRRLIGYSVAAHMRAEVVVDALRGAVELAGMATKAVSRSVHPDVRAVPSTGLCR
jgi:transposase InsO family protein